MKGCIDIQRQIPKRTRLKQHVFAVGVDASTLNSQGFMVISYQYDINMILILISGRRGCLSGFVFGLSSPHTCTLKKGNALEVRKEFSAVTFASRYDCWCSCVSHQTNQAAQRFSAPLFLNYRISWLGKAETSFSSLLGGRTSDFKCV